MDGRSEDVVIIGFAEALSAPEVAWSLVDAGYRVIAFAREGRDSALNCSRFVEIVEIASPEKDLTQSLHNLQDLIESYDGSKSQILLPLDDAALWLCNKVEKQPNWTLAGASEQCAELAINKQMQFEFAVRAGLNVPPTLFANSVEDVMGGVSTFPVILRPSDAIMHSNDRLKKGRNWICADETELLRSLAEWRGECALMVQPYILGRGEGVFGLATRSGVVAWSGHRRLRMMNPHGSGSSACASRSVPEELKGPIETFLRACGWRGMFMIELLRSHDDHLFFVELNGRAWGSMALSRRQGLEYPAWTVRMAIEPDWIPELSMRQPEEIECRNLGREIMHLLFILRGPQSKALHSWPSFWRTLLRMVRFNRPTFFYNWRANDWRVFVRDCLQTIGRQLFKGDGHRR